MCRSNIEPEIKKRNMETIGIIDYIVEKNTRVKSLREWREKMNTI
jgi:hypothetical protein